MFIIPKPGLSIRDPDQQDIIPAEGRVVANSEYWFRRLLDGDITLGPAGATPVRPIFQETASGTTAQRPNPAKLGDFRHNTELKAPEMFVGAPIGWLVFDGGVSSAAAAGQAAGEAAGAAAAQTAVQATNDALEATKAQVTALAASFESQTAALQATVQTLRKQVAALLSGTPPSTAEPPENTVLPFIADGAATAPLNTSAPSIGDVSAYVRPGYVRAGYVR